jgi:aspartyl-tRNA(Asn)/glutamyl-tRNA(Gln) amidotransferase subunit C
MQLSREEVAHVAWLARLTLTDAELDRYAEQLSGVLTHVQRLAELDVEAIEPTAMASESDQNVTRPDVPWQSWPQEAILANAAEVEAGSFRTQPILEESA